MKVLHLTHKKKWFDMILAGIKKEEYREIKPYWIKRIFKHPEIFNILSGHCTECKYRKDIDNYPGCSFDSIQKFNCDNMKFEWNDSYFKDYDVMASRNGYSKNAPKMDVNIKGIRIGEGNPGWGAEPGRKYFIIKLGDKL